MITTPVTGTATGTGTGPGAAAGAGAECEELAGALEQLVSMWRRLAVPGELSSTAAFTLARLSRDGPCRLTELAAHEKVSQPAMTQLVSRLEGQGLAQRCSEPSEGAAEQIPQAIAMAPDLVSIAAGGNDMLRPRTDPDTLAETFDEAVRTLLMAGCPVLMFTGSGDGCRGFAGGGWGRF